MGKLLIGGDRYGITHGPNAWENVSESKRIPSREREDCLWVIQPHTGREKFLDRTPSEISPFSLDLRALMKFCS